MILQSKILPAVAVIGLVIAIVVVVRGWQGTPPAQPVAQPVAQPAQAPFASYIVDIDENDAWRFTPGTRAVAFLRGNRDLKTALTFVRVEPYVTPKTSLTGSSTERVDTRVLQIIYRFDRQGLPVYVGQQMDVFIETPEAVGSADASGIPR